MISFKQFLLEEDELPSNVSASWEELPADDTTAIEGLLANNVDALESGDLIYRGFSGSLKDKLLFIDATKSKRSSRDTSGIYQAMMDASAAFKGYPSRSNSFICSASKVQNAYGTPYVMFPSKGTVIAESDIDDFIHNEIAGFAAKCFGLNAKIEVMNSRLARTIRDNFAVKVTHKSASEIDELLSKYSIGEFMVKMRFTESVSETVQQAIIAQINKQGGKNYFTAISQLLATPETFGVEKFKYGTRKPAEQSEVWFSGKALVVKNEYLINELLPKLPPEIKVANSIK